jgi:hypothetical protein
MIFSEKSKIYIPVNTDIRDVGIDTSTIREFLNECKNKNITIATSMIARPRSSITASAEASV